MPGRLTDRHPRLGASDLVGRFVPPPRFATATFESFEPNPEHPSQSAARNDLLAVVDRLRDGRRGSSGRNQTRRGLLRRGPDENTHGPRGRYLDGGFGVGKTHLLAAAWHRAPGPKAFLSFEELTAFIGFAGMGPAIKTFSTHRLLCIDEFELDDVANTRMAVTFLRSVVDAGATVVTTSNSVPDRLGEGRFNAEDFAREIQAIASHFEVIRIDGPDFRTIRADAGTALLDDGQVVAAASSLAGTVTLDPVEELLSHLRRVHPVQYRPLLDGIDTVAITGVRPIENQGAALLFVQFVDEVYDARVRFLAGGCDVGEIFPDAFRQGGYRKKYGRCESRLVELVAESSA